MESFVIEGGHPLKGDIDVYGSKNATTPIIAATLLSKEKSVISNIPLIEDVLNMLKIIESMGVKVRFISERKVEIDPLNFDLKKVDKKLIKKLRSSVLLVGGVSHKSSKFNLVQPGGCLIGVRSISTHLLALKELGVKIRATKEGYSIDYSKMHSAEICLEEFSVTATENILMIASLIKGKTILKTAAIEPHVIDLVDFLNKMGAKIKIKPGHVFEIEGVSSLEGANHKVIPDPIEAGTFIVMAAVCRGRVVVHNVRLDHLDLVLKKLESFGVKMEYVLENKKEKLYSVDVLSCSKLKANKIQTLPYPGIPTDLQSMFGVLATQCEGTSLIFDPMYESRLKYLDELNRMGANSIIAGPHRALITGVTPLYGREITSFDLRTGACLIIASLLARGTSKITNAYQVDRGYEKIELRLNKINANIKRINE